MSHKRKLKCPVCRAAFREECVCSRCGADLSMLMLAAAKAYWLRQAAISQLAQGNIESASEQNKKSIKLMDSKTGRRIEYLCVFLQQGL